ncbi:hypothetical protein Q4E93_03540 [Flavitalea sp. BT771]|uniref:hypothetical protein n=1 Tax=Flavitalea sp. BT771 TaxID=3063329 RepID=UPI0026E20088|nr:hypothetical protein [Flavitalea sp. BT771]MDO6429649.1 hypothetical protein [Flavitalea sp. BT771]MDV6218223.1 hypothetical protein [Flavitalea sp. BT771]
MARQQLEICILYWSKNGREVRFIDIVKDNDSIDMDEYAPEAFWSAMGGFEVTLNRYKTIFHSSDFHYLVKVTNFLIHSLYWIKGRTSDWFDKDEAFPNDVIVKSTGNNLIRLHSIDDKEISFSYTSSKDILISERGERFFEQVILDKQEWFKQTDIALKEYFDTLINIINRNESTEINKLMLEYYDVWEAISNIE